MNYHYYATPGSHSGPFKVAQQLPELLADSQITEELLQRVLDECATGVAPFVLNAPSQILFNWQDWREIWRWFTLHLVPNKAPPDCDPLDKAVIQFEDCTVYIYGRRYVPVVLEDAVMQGGA